MIDVWILLGAFRKPSVTRELSLRVKEKIWIACVRYRDLTVQWSLFNLLGSSYCLRLELLYNGIRKGRQDECFIPCCK